MTHLFWKLPKKGKSKYKNKKTMIDGYVFDSRKEALKYKELLLLKASGEVLNFKIQPKYLLQESFEKDGQKYRAIYYRADFEILYNNGRLEVLDIKPFSKKYGYFLTPVFKLKAKLFDFRYPELSLIIE